MSILLRSLLPTRLLPPSVIRWQHKMPTAPLIYRRHLPSVNPNFFVVKSLPNSPPHNPRMDERMFKLTLVSAENVADVRRWGRMKVYATVSLNGELVKTGVDKEGERNPRWDIVHNFVVKNSSLREPGSCMMVIKLYCDRTMGDKFIFEVKICVKTLFDKWLMGSDDNNQYVAETPSGNLNIKFAFEDIASST